jgi:GNAT superfamily N-acetyltransferase
MNFISTTADSIELKYFNNSNYNYQLIWEYIGPDRQHGDSYYSKKYVWYEVFGDTKVPIGIICLTENAHISFSLHLSVFEVLEKGVGHGSAIINYLLDWAKDMNYKYFTLFPHNNKLISFYNKFDITMHKIGNLMILGKVL